MEAKHEELYELQDCPACREGAGLMEHEGGWCCYVTVSYTHLDVYKRQVLRFWK